MNAGRSTKFRAAAAGVESTSATFLRSAVREESSPLVESPCYRDCALGAWVSVIARPSPPARSFVSRNNATTFVRFGSLIG